MKDRFLIEFRPVMQGLLDEGGPIAVCGDYNICHTSIDIHNPVSNANASGFKPEERAWMTKLLDDGGVVDVFRTLNQKAEQYTWWSNRGNARANNVGWRLDYHLATPALAALARREAIYKAEKFSDHAPLTIDYDFSL